MELNRYAFILVCATIIYNIDCHQSPFESMQKSMKVMEEQMESMLDSMEKMHQDFFVTAKKELTNQSDQGINITIEPTDNNAIKVNIVGIQAVQFEAIFSDKELTIKAPMATIVLSYHRGQLSASMNQEIRQEIIDEKTKEKTSQQLFASSSVVRQLIAQPIDLENAAIEFNKNNNALSVTIPAKEQTKTTKSIPVNVK